MNKKIVEDVEQEVERLLLADYEAEDVTYEVLERKENEEEDEDDDDEDEDMGNEVRGGDSDDEDFDLNAVIDEALEEPEEDADESEDDESAEESDQDPEEDPDEKNEENELKIQAITLRHEIAAMEVKLAEKNDQVSNQVNLIMKERFRGIVEKLARELELKREQLEKLQEEINEQEEG
ncbi:hypothetical protein HDU91_004220 [Kappamyces sp. JEL0680]|nr:hypothetical protein HDU91_004220 [Kappamyces sp. JEL0680]